MNQDVKDVKNELSSVPVGLSTFSQATLIPPAVFFCMRWIKYIEWTKDELFKFIIVL